MRRRNRDDKIGHFEDLYHYTAGADSIVSPLIAGHLSIEYLLRQLTIQYDPNLEQVTDELSHARLISLNRSLQTISSDQADFLVRINQIRNKFAHQLAYGLDISDIIDLFESASTIFSDYADQFDQCISELRKTPSKIHLNSTLLSELFLAIVYDLHQRFVALGGDEDMPHGIGSDST